MLGAIYIGMSGMDAYEQGLKTISNNVANLNTLGYKSTTVNFTDLFSHGGGLEASAGNGDLGTGDGVRFGTPYVDFGQGDMRSTDQSLDLAIQGDGFLVLLGDDKPAYARTGSFTLDTDGYISAQGTDRHLAILDASGNAAALNLTDKQTNPPKPTTRVVFSDNLSSSATEASVSSILVYDSLGNQQTWTVKFTRDANTSATGEWAVAVTDANGRTVGSATLRFLGSTIDPSTNKLVISDAPAGADPLDVTLDFSSGITSFSSGTTSTIRAASVDGNGTGDLTDVGIDEDGKIKLTYSNGQTELEGNVAIAEFRDPQRLERIGDGLFHDAGGASAVLRTSGGAGVGTLQSKQLEASNVNLSQEFGELILIQRGYQASSQVVSVANDMIQQLFGIKGQ
jgi:flagellar hook protein FlgE